MQLHLNTIILFVKDVNRLKQFYADIPGFEVTETIEPGWVLLKTGGCSIGLHEAGAAYQPASGEGSNTKLVFDTNEDLYALRERLIQQGAKAREIKSFTGYNYIYYLMAKTRRVMYFRSGRRGYKRRWSLIAFFNYFPCCLPV